MVITAGVICLIIPIAKHLGMPYALYVAAVAILPMITAQVLISQGRYLSIGFPVFILVAYVTRGKPALRDLILIVSMGFLAVFSVLYAAGYPFY
jgi:hypothetical protein